MNEYEWNQTLTQFQAFCLGYLMRKDLGSVRTQFEEIVRELDGGLEHLQWKGKILSRPHFTDTESLLLQYGRSKNECCERLDDSVEDQKIKNEESEASEVLLCERDEETPLNEERVVTPNLVNDFAAHWTSVNPDYSHCSLIQKGPHLGPEHTYESLRQQRSALAMELLWIQQAISSRKKYLTLRQKIDASH